MKKRSPLPLYTLLMQCPFVSIFALQHNDAWTAPALFQLLHNFFLHVDRLLVGPIIHGQQSGDKITEAVPTQFKVVRNPVVSRLTNLEPKLIDFFVLWNVQHTVRFGSLEPFTVCKIGDFPHFLSALASNNQFMIKLVKMQSGRTPHVVVETLKISLDQLPVDKV